MTVQDLIDELKRHDPHLPVLIDGQEIDYVKTGANPCNYRACVQLLTHRPANTMHFKDPNQYEVRKVSWK